MLQLSLGLYSRISPLKDVVIKSFNSFFPGEEKAVLMEVDHEAKQVFVEELRTVPEDQRGAAARHLAPSEDSITARLTSPIVRTFLDTDKISFERYLS